MPENKDPSKAVTNAKKAAPKAKKATPKAKKAAPGEKAKAKPPAKRASTRKGVLTGASAPSSGPVTPLLDFNHIAVAAYFKFKNRESCGHPPDPVADWFAAEDELLATRKK